MSYSRIRNLQIKAHLLARRREEQLRKFRNARRSKPRVDCRREHVWGGFSFETYTKDSVALRASSRKDEELDVITNQNLMRDTTLLWHTTGQNVSTALRRGELKPDALTSKAMRALGAYFKKSAGRTVKSRFQSYLYREKELLATWAQDGFEHLQGLERCLNQRIEGHSTAEVVAERLCGELRAYIKKQQLNADDQQQKKALLESKREGAWREEFHRARIRGLEAVYQKNISAARALIRLIDKNKKEAEWLENTANEKIFLFLKGRIIVNTRCMQALNQVLTHLPGSKAYLRGDLNSFAEDVIKVARDLDEDVHHPVTRDHQLVYRPDEEITVNSDTHTDGSVQQLDDFMLIVSEISGNNTPLIQEKGPISHKVSATKWRHGRSYYDPNFYEPSIFKDADYLKGWLRNLCLSPFILLETAVRGNKAKFFSQLAYTPPDNERKIGDKINYYALTARIKRQTSIATKIGMELYKTFNYLFVEGLLRGLADGLEQFGRFPKDLSVDFQNAEAKIEDVLRDLKKELKGIHRQEKLLLQKDKKEQAKKKNKPAEAELRYAGSEFPLKPYCSHGIWNSGVGGVTGFFDLFGHNMLAKQPFTAFSSILGAGVSFFAFYWPVLATNFFGKAYVKFLHGQGFIWGRDLFSASMAGAFTNFKLVGVLIEGIEHGPDSWFAKGLSQLINDPAKSITFVTLSWVVGYSLLYLVDIPGLSEELRRHIGNPPQLSEIFGGAKIGIIAYHLLSNPHADLEEIRKNYIEECVQNYREAEKRRGNRVTETDASNVRNCLEKWITLERLEKLREEVRKARAQPSSPEAQALVLTLQLATHKEKLSHLTPALKAKLQYWLSRLLARKEDVTAIDQYIDPEKYAPKSTLRSFLGRAIGYLPVLIRCSLSPAAGIKTGSWVAMSRPWKDLGAMLLDDLTSTLHALSRLGNKIVESVFNRLPRTVLDVLVNGIVARVASFFNYHDLTLAGYQISAEYDLAQEELYANTTGRVLRYLFRKNTTPHPAFSLRCVLKEKMENYCSSQEQEPFSLPRSRSLPVFTEKKEEELEDGRRSPPQLRG